MSYSGTKKHQTGSKIGYLASDERYELKKIAISTV
jgi:hypothetical protein